MCQRTQLSQLQVSLAHGSSPRRLQDLRKVPMLTAPWRAVAPTRLPTPEGFFLQKKHTTLSSWKMTNPFWNKKGTRKCQNKIGKKTGACRPCLCWCSFADLILASHRRQQKGSHILGHFRTDFVSNTSTSDHALRCFDKQKSLPPKQNTVKSRQGVLWRSHFCNANPDPSRFPGCTCWKAGSLSGWT